MGPPQQQSPFTSHSEGRGPCIAMSTATPVSSPQLASSRTISAIARMQAQRSNGDAASVNRRLRVEDNPPHPRRGVVQAITRDSGPPTVLETITP